jgi:hypothetical protein
VREKRGKEKWKGKKNTGNKKKEFTLSGLSV